jgi:hypothetical protein
MYEIFTSCTKSAGPTLNFSIRYWLSLLGAVDLLLGARSRTSGTDCSYANIAV